LIREGLDTKLSAVRDLIERVPQERQQVPVSVATAGAYAPAAVPASAVAEEAQRKYLLVSFTTCPWVQRSAIVLREKRIEFKFRHIEPDNRPDWFLAISPQKKVPVLLIDDRVVLFESNAINEYLDETISPRLHPADPIERAINRAWTDYVPTFASIVTATAYADTEADYNKAVEQIPVPFERVEKALEKQGSGPFFNGAKYSLVDAAYAPFLQRYVFLDRIKKLGHLEKYPRLWVWCEALLQRQSTHSFPPAEFEAMYRDNLKRRKKWVSRFVEPAMTAVH
jgi:glutathione S-transferase